MIFAVNVSDESAPAEPTCTLYAAAADSNVGVAVSLILICYFNELNILR